MDWEGLAAKVPAAPAVEDEEMPSWRTRDGAPLSGEAFQSGPGNL